MKNLLILSVSLFMTACFAAAPTQAPVAPDTRNQCEAICSEMQMEVGAVMVMDSHVGCACVPYKSTASVACSAAVAGYVPILQAKKQAQSAQQQQQQQY